MTQPKIDLNHLKRYLKERPREELISDIAELFKRFSGVKDYYQLKVYPQGEMEVPARYKKMIEDEFFPARGFGQARLSVAKKAISEYKKVRPSAAGLIDLMLFYVEQGVKFTRAYGDIDEPFYLSMEGMYQKALSLIVRSEMEGSFEGRCRRIVEDTSGMGWGFHDTLSQLYEESFP
jgi:hypothetical protein